MNYTKFHKCVTEHLSNYKNKHFQHIPDGDYRGKSYKYILPKNFLNLNYLKMSIEPNEIKYHLYAHHLNSSQIMCINFFSPLLTEEKLLIEIICRRLNIARSPEMKIKKAKFEHTPNGNKHTNFDFYVELTSGEKFYFEIKYTENGFGRTTEDKKYPDRYKKEWELFYKDQVYESMHLKGMTESDFYSNYQINRNIAYVQNDNTYVCFVYPYDNDSLHKKLGLVELKNVYKINWDDLCEIALCVTKDTEYLEHFIAFKEKYLDYKSN